MVKDGGVKDFSDLVGGMERGRRAACHHSAPGVVSRSPLPLDAAVEGAAVAGKEDGGGGGGIGHHVDGGAVVFVGEVARLNVEGQALLGAIAELQAQQGVRVCKGGACQVGGKAEGRPLQRGAGVKAAGVLIDELRAVLHGRVARQQAAAIGGVLVEAEVVPEEVLVQHQAVG